MQKALVMMLVCCGALLARAADTTDPYGLKGISEVNLDIGYLGPIEAEIGLTQDAIRTDVELPLRIAGIKITPTVRYRLYVNILVSARVRAREAEVIVELHQPVIVPRNQLEILAKTWARSRTITAPSADSIRSCLKDRLDEFLGEWRKQNPPKR